MRIYQTDFEPRAATALAEIVGDKWLRAERREQDLLGHQGGAAALPPQPRAFADLHHARGDDFPPECKCGDYEKRIQAAHPIHPEIFDRLYTDWSALPSGQMKMELDRTDESQ